MFDMREDEWCDEMRYGYVVFYGELYIFEIIEQQVLDKVIDELKKFVGGDDDDDEFDMFVEDFDEDKYVIKFIKVVGFIEVIDGEIVMFVENKGGIFEGDDKDGYYKI